VRLVSYTIYLIGVLLIVGSATPPKKILVTEPYSEEELLRYSNGQHTITGQAFMRQRGGGVVTCAGAEVTIVPLTKFAEKILQVRLSGNTPQYSTQEQVAGGGRSRSYIQKAICDAQGNFIFNKVSKGRWFFETKVSWRVGDSYQGGYVRKKVKITGDQRVILSN